MNIVTGKKQAIQLAGAGMISVLLMTGCTKDVRTFRDIHFIYTTDPTQERLDNLGNPADVPAGHAVQSPDMQLMSIHYIEVTADATTLFKEGALLYQAPETDAGGDKAIDFSQSNRTAPGAEFLQVNLERLPPGTYSYIRASVAYQQYSVLFDVHNIPGIGTLADQSGVLASFVGYRTYITDLTIQNLTTPINANRDQGFWGFETLFTDDLAAFNAIYTGQSPAGATTVVNPIDATSPVPEGSCVVTGAFAEPLVVTGEETGELSITLHFSTNGSFEWIDTDGDEVWDVDALDPGQTEQVIDMGLRGMIATWEWLE